MDHFSPDTKKPVHIAIHPGPGTGHLNPILEFCKRLIQVSPPNTFSITFITIPNSSSDEDINKLTQAQTSFLSTLPHGSGDVVQFISLPPPVFSKEEFPTFTDQLLAKVFLTAKHTLPSLRELLTNLSASKKGPVKSLFVDMFGSDAIDLALELGIEPYVCFPSGAMALRLYLEVEEMDKRVAGEYVDMIEPLKFPGCVPLYGKDLPDPLMNRENGLTYRWFLDHAKRYSLAKGIVVNTFEAFEAEIIKGLKEDVRVKPAIYPIGPLTKTTTEEVCVPNKEDTDAPHGDDDQVVGHQRDECLKWLDQQPPESVLFVSFGSGGTLSTKQMDEIASGLEMSGERFLWVVRVPNDEIPFGSYLGFDDAKNPLDFLPQGFVERTKDRGFLVPNWAPQVQILSHGSTGGFLTHCGWNSTLESAVSGVPYIAWPLYAEQRMNAVFLEEDLKAGLRVRVDDEVDGLVKSEQIVRLVKRLMAGDEGKEMRKKMKVMRDEAGKAVVESGSSYVAISELATELSRCG